MVKTLHMIWLDNPIPTISQQCLDRNIKVAESCGWEFVFHTNLSDDLLGEYAKYKKDCTKRYEEIYETYEFAKQSVNGEPHLPHIADILRLECLFEFGGLYLDCDFYILRDDMDDVVGDDPRVQVHVDNDIVINNGFMYAPQPRMPLFDKLCSNYDLIIGRGWAVTGGKYLEHFTSVHDNKTLKRKRSVAPFGPGFISNLMKTSPVGETIEINIDYYKYNERLKTITFFCETVRKSGRHLVIKESDK